MHSFPSQEHFSTNNKVDAIAGSEMVENVIFFLPMLVRGAAFVTKLFRILVYEKKLHYIVRRRYSMLRCVWERNLILHNFVIDKRKKKRKMRRNFRHQTWIRVFSRKVFALRLKMILVILKLPLSRSAGCSIVKI